jgi:hypothetical protein
MKGKGSKGNKSNWLLIAIVLIATVLISGLLISNKEVIQEGFFGGSTKKIYSVEYYYMDGCSHCDKFSEPGGIWEQLNKIKWNNVTLKKYNCADHEDRVKKFNINGYPSIVIVDNTVTPNILLSSFEEDRTYENLFKFINKYEQM